MAFGFVVSNLDSPFGFWIHRFFNLDLRLALSGHRKNPIIFHSDACGASVFK